VNLRASYYEHCVSELAGEPPFSSNDMDFCGDHRPVFGLRGTLRRNGPYRDVR
jgi:hypothetical protein